MALPVPARDDEPSFADLLAARPHLSRHALDGLCLEGIPLAAIARDTGTPTWVYGAGTLRARFRALRAALDAVGLERCAIHYAVKANAHLALLALLAAEGAGADVVSGGELLRSRAAGIIPGRIVFSGVGKTMAELALAAEQGVAQVNVESAAELDMLAAAAAGRPVRVALRVNPDVDAGTHGKITTGRADNKFGVAPAEVPALWRRAAALPGIEPVGLAVHIGSQVNAMAPFRAAWDRVAGLVRDLRAEGHAVRAVDCGGGLGIAYRDEAAPWPAAFAGAIAATLGGLDVELAIEPGRWLVGPAGLLLASVVLEKQAGARRFVVLDAAMNDLLRPAMYDAWHAILPLGAAELVAPATPADVVGPVCETGDTFARARALPRLAAGACVAILDAGAYGSAMSSTYNARPLAAEVLADGAAGRWDLIRPRQPVEALWRDERVPHWVGERA